ncbi:hypothetical protein UA74_21605 [Actinoalloteichus fjordicus]|uniref:Uncharacterized protein n=1 Tax=Actinoalloteichus fjordicus TaxID=1612552 RepID=A0AAC9PTN9_9PSEU|nr:hypothetical protein UA74_21605 [Actinoalloteichus fjordicus]
MVSTATTRPRTLACVARCSTSRARDFSPSGPGDSLVALRRTNRRCCPIVLRLSGAEDREQGGRRLVAWRPARLSNPAIGVVARARRRLGQVSRRRSARRQGAKTAGVPGAGVPAEAGTPIPGVPAGTEFGRSGRDSTNRHRPAATGGACRSPPATGYGAGPTDYRVRRSIDHRVQLIMVTEEPWLPDHHGRQRRLFGRRPVRPHDRSRADGHRSAAEGNAGSPCGRAAPARRSSVGATRSTATVGRL